MNRRGDRVRDPREEILLETNFDDDGSAVTRAYNSNSSHQSQQPLQQKVRRNGFRSEQSLDRYSVHGRSEGDCCQSCMTRIPYATLIATLMCLLGVGIFCGTMYRGASLSIIMIDQVFHKRILW
ncbi:GPM6B family protein [Megaselia abdita]